MRCVKCGSEFLLTEHHTKERHLNQKERKSKGKEILCETCHYEDNGDFVKSLNCYFKALEKRYNRKMEKIVKCKQ